MRRLLAALVPLALLAACGDGDDASGAPTSTVVADDPSEGADEADVSASETETEADEPPSETTVPDTTIPADAPAVDAPDGGGAEDEGLGDVLLVSDLSGSAVAPGAGHPTATGRFEAELHEGVLCVDLEVSGLGSAVTRAELHAAGGGDVIADLGTPSAPDGDPLRWTDACTEVSDDVIERIAAAPEQVHVDVHTAGHPDGAVRGQLAVASVFDRTLDG